MYCRAYITRHTMHIYMYHQALEQERQKLVDAGEGYKREREKLVRDNERLASLLTAGDPSAEASVLQV